MIRQPLVVVMGNVDSGKCVHPSSLICLSNGEVLKIEDLWNNKLEKDTYLEEDSKGFYFKPNLNLYNIDINKKKYEKREIFRICKLKSPKELVYFKNNFGQEIQVTKEHPFFILNGSNIKSKKAIDVKEGDFVLCPKIIKKDSLDFNDCRDYILNLLLKEDIFLFKLSNKKNLEVERVLRKNKLFSKLQNKINNNRYRNNDLLFLQKYLSIKNKEIISIKFSTKKQRASHRSNWINIPKTQKGLKELFYLVGLIFGDGTSQGTSITNIDEEIHKNAINIFRSYLGVNAKIYKPKEKAENIVNNGGKTLKLFLEIVFSFPKFKKSNNLKIPKIIELSNPKLIGSFLSGYFDADGYVSDEKGIIEISSASQEIYKKLPFLLHYLGCSHSIFIKKNKGKNYHYISIAGKDDLLTFKKNIGFRLTRKSVSLTNNIKKAVSNRKSDIFPISKDFLRNTRINLGLSQNQIPISFWGKYESNQNITKDIFYNFISFCENNNLLIKKKIKEKTEILKQSSKIKSIYLQNKSNFKTYNLLRELAADGLIKINNKNKSYKLTNFGKKIYSNWSKNPIDNILTTLISFKPLLNTEVHFVGIKEKRIVPSDTEFVYDLSEPFNENFVSNGFIIHNTQTLDTIRRTAVIKSEAGAITQMISSSSISLNTIQKICGDLLKGKNINLPGLVFIDTPGHAAFSNMRKRGGNLADIAILVVNINEGIKPQTIECIAILKKYKTPFVIALNKLDLIPGWQETNEKMVLNMIAKQSPNVQQHIETKLYEIVGKLHEEGFQTERFDRVHDYTNTIAMVPCSAKLGLGIPELLMVLMGLAQKFLEKNLETDLTGPAKGTVLEVKEEQGLGTTINAIIYEGTIKVNDPIIIGGVIEPIVTKVKGLFEPDEKNKFKPVKEIVAAAGIKLSAVGIKDVVSGMPFFV
ncbi:MAG: hypothetical protein ISS01_02275, partial [Nanoarchaeota archaeon]|nr:hypothetical protein [Nanoarchaeota archaeon]